MTNFLLLVVMAVILLGLLSWVIWLTVIVRRTSAQLASEILKSRQRSKKYAGNVEEFYLLDQTVDSLVRRIQSLEAQKSAPTWKPRLEGNPQGMREISGLPNQDAPGDDQGPSKSYTEIPRDEDRSEEAVQAYNSLAAAFEPQRRDQFVEQFHPKVCSFESGEFRENPDGNLWVIKVGGNSDLLVVPIGKVARDWDKLYRKMQGMTAKSEFGDLFAFTEGGRFKLEAPARAADRFGRIELTAKGHLTGI